MHFPPVHRAIAHIDFDFGGRYSAPAPPPRRPSRSGRAPAPRPAVPRPLEPPPRQQVETLAKALETPSAVAIESDEGGLWIQDTYLPLP
ncbi:MAG: hypothetical protein AB7S38_08925 [Vulcanimicrobiota bacterium]